jgi:hypothetical protein
VLPLLASCLLPMAAGIWTPARAGSIVIYRCTDAYGHLTIQNDVPCPKGTHQEKQVVEPPPPLPAYQPIVIPAPAPQAPPAPPGTAVIPPAPAAPIRPPAPAPLYRCTTRDNDSYFSETETPAPRCVALQVVGLDGTAEAAAGAACERVSDSCARVPEADACDAWRQRLRDAETAWRFGRREQAEEHQAEYERIRRLIGESSCGQATGPT